MTTVSIQPPLATRRAEPRPGGEFHISTRILGPPITMNISGGAKGWRGVLKAIRDGRRSGAEFVSIFDSRFLYG